MQPGNSQITKHYATTPRGHAAGLPNPKLGMLLAVQHTPAAAAEANTSSAKHCLNTLFRQHRCEDLC
jgi:hypothetical protein